MKASILPTRLLPVFGLTASFSLSAAILSTHTFTNLVDDTVDVVDVSNSASPILGISTVSDLSFGAGLNTMATGTDLVHTSNTGAPTNAQGAISYSTASLRGGGASRFLMISESSSWQNTEAGALTNNSYLGFTLNVDSGYQVDLTSFTYKFSDNNAASDLMKNAYVAINDSKIGATQTTNPNRSTLDLTFDLSSVSSLGAGTVDVKLYLWSGTGAANGNRNVQFDDFTLNGDVSSIPEPSSLMLVGLALVGLGVLHKKRS